MEGTAQTKSIGNTTTGMSRLDLRNEKVRAVAQHEPRTVPPTTSLGDGLAQMRAEGGDALLITEGGRLVGILTERDVLTRILGQDIDESRPVSEFMTREPHTLDAEATLLDAMKAMEGGHYRNLPLVEDGGRVVGMLRQNDLLEYVAEAFPQEILNLPPRPHQLMEAPEGA